MDYSLQNYIKKLSDHVLEQQLALRIADGATAEDDFVISIIENELKKRKDNSTGE